MFYKRFRTMVRLKELCLFTETNHQTGHEAMSCNREQISAETILMTLTDSVVQSVKNIQRFRKSARRLCECDRL